MRPRRARQINRALVAAAAALVTLGTAAFVGVAEAQAEPGGCQTDLWGFLGSQRRTICDSPDRADGSWSRGRVIWTPAHNVPFSCYTSGGSYSSYTTCSGGYYVNQTVQAEDYYTVTPDTVLPDEPGHL